MYMISCACNTFSKYFFRKQISLSVLSDSLPVIKELLAEIKIVSEFTEVSSQNNLYTVCVQVKSENYKIWLS